jgi:glutamine synthetase
VLPPIPLHSGDRNRTSPMAFTGNRFEFRAVGSSQSIAGPLVALNTAMAESLDYCASVLEAQDTKTPEKLGKAVAKLVKDIYTECEAICFNGDGYSAAWHQEAARRGLPNLKTSADALPELKSKEVLKLLSHYKVLSKRETESRYEVYAEQYRKSINVESNLMVEMASTMILPSALRYQTELATAHNALLAAGIEGSNELLQQVSSLVAGLQQAIASLKAAKATHHKDIKAECDWCRDGILPAMEALRTVVDELEGLVADDLWPLPTYQEMLFIK